MGELENPYHWFDLSGSHWKVYSVADFGGMTTEKWLTSVKFLLKTSQDPSPCSTPAEGTFEHEVFWLDILRERLWKVVDDLPTEVYKCQSQSWRKWTMKIRLRFPFPQHLFPQRVFHPPSVAENAVLGHKQKETCQAKPRNAPCTSRDTTTEKTLLKNENPWTMDSPFMSHDEGRDFESNQWQKEPISGQNRGITFKILQILVERPYTTILGDDNGHIVTCYSRTMHFWFPIWPPAL